MVACVGEARAVDIRCDGAERGRPGRETRRFASRPRGVFEAKRRTRRGLCAFNLNRAMHAFVVDRSIPIVARKIRSFVSRQCGLEVRMPAWPSSRGGRCSEDAQAVPSEERVEPRKDRGGDRLPQSFDEKRVVVLAELRQVGGDAVDLSAERGLAGGCEQRREGFPPRRVEVALKVSLYAGAQERTQLPRTAT